jgi:hypothetical protein
MLSRAKAFFEKATEEEKKLISIKSVFLGVGHHAHGFQRVDGMGK